MERFHEAQRETTLAVDQVRRVVDAKRSSQGKEPLPQDWCQAREQLSRALQAIQDGTDPTEHPEAYACLAQQCRDALHTATLELSDVGVTLVKLLAGNVITPFTFSFPRGGGRVGGGGALAMACCG